MDGFVGVIKTHVCLTVRSVSPRAGLAMVYELCVLYMITADTVSHQD